MFKGHDITIIEYLLILYFKSVFICVKNPFVLHMEDVAFILNINVILVLFQEITYFANVLNSSNALLKSPVVSDISLYLPSKTENGKAITSTIE